MIVASDDLVEVRRRTHAGHRGRYDEANMASIDR
jgi:hypothetical protein